MLKFFFFTSAGTCEKDMLILLWSLETVENFSTVVSYHKEFSIRNKFYARRYSQAQRNGTEAQARNQLGTTGGAKSFSEKVRNIFNYEQ